MRVLYSIRKRNIQDLPGTAVEISQTAPSAICVSLNGLSISNHGGVGVSFSMLMCYNELIMRLGVTVR